MSDDRNQEVEEEEIQEQEAPSDEEQSYDDMFDDLWGGDKSDKPESSEPTEEVEEEDSEEDDESADEEEGQEEQEAPKEDPKPEPKQKSEEPDPYAWIDSLPEEVKDQARNLKNQATSHQGRATAFQRRVSELQQELRRQEQARAAAPADRKPQAPESAAPEQLKKFEQLKEDFPEFAEALEEVRSFERKRVEEQLQEKFRPLEEEKIRKARQSFEQAVETAAEKIFNTTETGVHWKDVVKGNDFRAWLELQPRSVQQAATLPDSEEAIFVLRKYEDDYQRAVKELGLDSPPKEEKGAVSDEAARAKKIKAERDKRKQVSTAPGSKPADGNRDSTGGDYTAMFDAMWGK